MEKKEMGEGGADGGFSGEKKDGTSSGFSGG